MADRPGALPPPEEITTVQLREFQAHLLAPREAGGVGMKNGSVCTGTNALKLFFDFPEDEDDLPNPMRRVARPAEQEVTIHPFTEDQLAALLETCKGRDFEAATWPSSASTPPPP